MRIPVSTQEPIKTLAAQPTMVRRILKAISTGGGSYDQEFVVPMGVVRHIDMIYVFAEYDLVDAGQYVEVEIDSSMPDQTTNVMFYALICPWASDYNQKVVFVPGGGGETSTFAGGGGTTPQTYRQYAIPDLWLKGNESIEIRGRNFAAGEALFTYVSFTEAII